MSEKIKVLLAEDESQYGIVIRNWLKDASYSVTCVRDVQGAERRLPDADVLIMDVLIPEVEKPESNIEPLPPANGIKAVARMIRKGRLRSEVPVIFISAYITDLTQRIENCSIPSNRCVCLEKPFVRDVLLSLIKLELESRRKKRKGVEESGA
jgi:DNA-binding response OmpR family regulator